MNYEDFEEMGGASKVFFLDTNLSSPVLTTELDSTRQLFLDAIASNDRAHFFQLHNNQRTAISFFRKLCKSRGFSQHSLLNMPQLQPEDYPQVERNMLLQDETYDSSYTVSKELCQEIEEALIAGLEARGLPGDEVRGTTELLDTPEASAFRAAYEQFSDLFGRAESRVKTNEYMWSRGQIGHVDITLNAHHAIVTIRSESWYSSLNQVLMLKDKLATRYMLLEHVKPLGLDPVLIEHLLALFQWQDETLELYGNQSYNILKTVEPMFKTRLSHIIDNVFGNDTAYTRMIVKTQEKEDKIRRATGIHGYDQMKKLQLIVEKVQGTRNNVEMFGCLKSCGHPIIDPRLGGLSAAEEARTPDHTTMTDAQELRNTFCHTVLVAYVKKHGRWPRLIHMRRGTTLNKLNDEQERNLDYNSYPLSDWTTTEWTKILEFDYFPNFLELMDDKSISYYKSDKNLSWDHGRKPTSQKRLLLELLAREEIDIKQLIQRISRGNIPDDWFIVSLYPKEREFKIEPRMFAMLVLEMRCFFTAIEANIADSLFRYLPQQTMTETKTQIQERFLAFTDPNKNTSDYTLFLEIDLTRWNLRWRELVIHMLGHDLNMMFGMPGTFTVTHQFFAKSQILVRVSGLRPEGIELKNPPTTSLAWSDHLGGFEGLNQKLWTAATYAMVETALIPLMRGGTILNYELVGQGDNQVVRLAIPAKGESREEIIPRVRDVVNEALETACSRVNQIVKPDENIESTSVLTYSKVVYVLGVEYATSLKSHSRLFPVTSMDFPSVTSNARAILSGAVAGGEAALYPLRSALIGCYHAMRYLRSASKGYSIHARSFPKLSDRELIACVVLPASIGGLAGMNFASFFYKGGSDPLGKEISGMKLLSEGSSVASVLCSSALGALEDKYYIDEDPDPITLIDNPYALPLMKAVSPLSQVGSLSLAAFRGKVNNNQIQPLLTKEINKEEDVLKQDLLGIKPFNPILLHDLFEASGFGTIKLMRKMFVHTRTVQTIAQWVNPQITHTFLRSDLNEIIGFKDWLKGFPAKGYSGLSSFDLCKKFRSYWNRSLEGVTNYQPLDCIHRRDSTRSSSSIKWSAHSHGDLLTSRGPLSGYIGTATREKRSEHGYKIVDTGAPSRSVTKLQLIRSQAYGNKNFNELIDRIALTRSPVRISDITDFLPKVIGGSIIHRFASVIRSMAASYVGPLNFVTHIRIDTDSIGKISGSALNYPIMIQEHTVVAQAGAKLNYIHRGSKSGELMIHTEDMIALPDSTITCSEPVFQDASLPKSRLLYNTTLHLTRTYDNVVMAVPNHAVVKPSMYESASAIHDSFVGFFMNTLRDQNRAKQIADTRGHASIPSRFQIDIAEAHAVGPMNIVKAIAEAVVLTTFRDTFRTLQLHPDRWDESMFMVQNILVCLKSCAGYWSHPLFQTHTDYPKLRSSSLRYGQKIGRYSRLEGNVRRQISLIMISQHTAFWRNRVPVFSGENSTQVAEALTLAGAKAIVKMRLIGNPNYQLYARLYSGYTRLPKGSTLSSSNILDLLRIRFTGLAQSIKKMGDHLLARDLTHIANVRGISVYNDDVRTVMRNARSLIPSTRIPITKSLRPSSKGFINCLDHCAQCLPPARTVYSIMWDRYKHRRNGGVAAAGYTWLPLITRLELSHTVLIVGNGNGGLADLLLTCFDTDVIGLDLEHDMPVDSATLLNYLPVGIKMENRSRFIQSDWSINSSGNWLEEDVREKVLTTLPQLSTVFVDATGPDPIEILDASSKTMEHVLVSNCYARVIGDSTAIFEHISVLSEIYNTTTFVVSHSTVDVELIVHISRQRTPPHRCMKAPMLIDVLLPESMHAVIPEKRGELLEAATNYCISWNGESLYESNAVMKNLCLSLLNKSKKRQLVYRQRTDLMIGYAVTFALCSDSPLGLVQSWISDEEIETDVFRFALRESIITHLLRYTARLSSITDTSELFFS